MGNPANIIELEIARILVIFDNQCKRFKVDKQLTTAEEVATAENSEANGDSRKLAQD